MLLRADDIVHDDASPVKARIERKAFRGSEFLYTLRLASGEQVLAHVPSHHDHQVGEWIGIRAAGGPRRDLRREPAQRRDGEASSGTSRPVFRGATSAQANSQRAPWLYTGVDSTSNQPAWTGRTRMGGKLKVAGFIALGAVAGALTTMQLQAIARSTLAPLPLEELQQLAAVFGMVKSDYVEPVDEKKLITDAISGMVAGLDPHSQYFDKKSFKEFREGTDRQVRRRRHRDRHGRRPGEGASRRSKARPPSAPA